LTTCQHVAPRNKIHHSYTGDSPSPLALSLLERVSFLFHTITHKKNSPTHLRGAVVQIGEKLFLDEDGCVGLIRSVDESRHTYCLNPVQQLVFLNTHQVHGHLAGFNDHTIVHGALDQFGQ